MKPSSHTSSKKTVDPVLDEVMVELAPSDAIRFRDCIEGGVLITGGLGSGKSSTSARTIAMAFLRSGKGGLVLTVKSDETEHWRSYAKLAGREEHLLIFNAQSGLCFDFVAYAWGIAGRSAGQVETVVELLTLLTSSGKPQGQSESGRYFENAVEEILRATVIVLANAGEPISITSIHKIISSLPTDKDQIEDEAWQASSACGRLIVKLRERKDQFTSSQWEDLDVAVTYLMEKWPDRTPVPGRTSSPRGQVWPRNLPTIPSAPCSAAAA